MLLKSMSYGMGYHFIQTQMSLSYINQNLALDSQRLVEAQLVERRRTAYKLLPQGAGVEPGLVKPRVVEEMGIGKGNLGIGEGEVRILFSLF